MTGWKELESKWYCFYEDGKEEGKMAVSTEIYGYEIGSGGQGKGY